jgi:hypothetical protein
LRLTRFERATFRSAKKRDYVLLITYPHRSPHNSLQDKELRSRPCRRQQQRRTQGHKQAQDSLCLFICSLSARLANLKTGFIGHFSFYEPDSAGYRKKCLRANNKRAVAHLI